MNFVSTFGAAALSCLLLPAAFASAPAGSALESSSAAIAPEVREVEKAPSSELAAAPTAPAVLLTIGRNVYAVSGTASIISALSQWRRTLADAVMDESDRTRIAALQTVLDETPLGRIAP